MENAGSSLSRRAIKYLPVLPLVILIGYHAALVDPYPSQIRVTQRSCADPANNARLVFRQQSYCVTTSEAQQWDAMWRNEYLLIAAFALCWAISAVVGRGNAQLT